MVVLAKYGQKGTPFGPLPGYPLLTGPGQGDIVKTWWFWPYPVKKGVSGGPRPLPGAILATLAAFSLEMLLQTP